MKKYPLFLFVLALFFSFFNISYATLYYSGCGGNDQYNTATGESCNGYRSQVDISFSKELKIGSRGSEVQTLQRVLKSEGYFSGSIDGSYGKKTVKAVRAFQDDKNIPVTGNVDATTIAKLNTVSNVTGNTSSANSSATYLNSIKSSVPSQSSRMTTALPPGCISNEGFSTVTAGTPCDGTTRSIPGPASCPITDVNGIAQHVCPTSIPGPATCPIVDVGGVAQHVCPTTTSIPGPTSCPIVDVGGVAQHVCPPVAPSCSATHYSCTSGTPFNGYDNSSAYYWLCRNTVGTDAYCSEIKQTTTAPVAPSCSTTHYSCTSGIAINGSESTTSWSWLCRNSANIDAGCKEEKTVTTPPPAAPSCSATHYSCTSGTPFNGYDNSSAYYWLCRNTVGTDAHCSEIKQTTTAPVAPACSTTTHYLCSSGTPINGSEDNSNWYWLCRNSANVDVSCSISKVVGLNKTSNLAASAISAFTSPETVPAGEQVASTTSFHFTLWLEQGMSGNEVMELQKYLNKAGYDVGAVDGIFGPKVKDALIKFQTANGLKADGIVGYEVRGFLNK